MTSEDERGSRMRNTDFSIARILANDTTSSCCCETRLSLDERDDDAIRNDDDDDGVARKSRKRRVDEEENIARDRETKNELRERLLGTRYGKEEERDDEERVVVAETNNDVIRVDATRRSDLTWLHYTRYRPPKLPRRSLVEKRTKRRAGDHPRIPFSSSQLEVLENRYRRSAYLSRNDVIEISATLRLPQSKVRQKK
ncbi:uncharacterized protein LOC109853469 [Pseudomyrmex gracilis]|uniref:uncharacterized protein LOC109853469 n=1 Tax=Pseudomyrmex gracilis TaxID=219809 RepID=UPI000994C117|nr:uncharacterized protein LOC109853469 [Pseudomyrmex gracilis]